MPSFLFRSQVNSSPAESIHPTHLNQRPRCAIDVIGPRFGLTPKARQQ